MSLFSAAHVILISLGRSRLKYYITLNFSTSLYCLLSLSLLFFLWCFLKTTDSIFALLFTFIYFKCRHPESLPVKDPALVSKPEAVTQCFHSSGELCVRVRRDPSLTQTPKPALTVSRVRCHFLSREPVVQLFRVGISDLASVLMWIWSKWVPSLNYLYCVINYTVWGPWGLFVFIVDQPLNLFT